MANLLVWVPCSTYNKFFIIDNTDPNSDAPDTKSLLADNKINIPYLEDSWKVGIKYGIKSIPTIFTVDKFGTIQNIRIGYTKEEEDLVGDLSEIINQLLRQWKNIY